MPSTIQVLGIDVHLDGPDAQGTEAVSGAPVMVMIHGWPDTYRLWDGQVAHFKTQFQCVRFTLPGFDVALAPRPTGVADMMTFYAAVLDAVSPNAPVTLMLHDWGCVFGYEFAARHPTRVARIVAVDVGDHNSGAFIRSLPLLGKLGVAGYQLWLAIAAQLGGVGTAMTRWMAAKLGCRTPPQAIGAQQNHPYVLQWTGGFKSLASVRPHPRMMYLYGLRKPFMFHSPKWLALIDGQSGSETHAMPTGHWVMLQEPQRFNELVERWLNEPA